MMMNNNFNNNGFGNGFNNNFNNGGFNNNGWGGGFQQPQQQMSYNAAQILNTIEQTIQSIERGQASGKEVVNTLNNLVAQNLIKILGKGTNRTVIELNVPHDEIKDLCGINRSIPIVFKVPIQILAAKLANNREAFVSQILLEGQKSNHPDLGYLFNVEPYAVMVPGTKILACEKVVPIEYSKPIMDRIRGTFGNNINMNGPSGEAAYTDPDFAFKNSVGEIIRDYLVKDGQANPQVVKLVELLQKYFVIADINPEFSPFNYGLKNINGQGFITILDLGSCLPKNGFEVKCPKCGHLMRQIFPWTQGLTRDEENKLKSRGKYVCMNQNCTNSGPTIMDDTEVFEMHRNNLKQQIFNSGQNYNLLETI